MKAGEKELRKAFEEVAVRNLESARAYGEFTQELVDTLEKKVENLDGVIRQYDSKFEVLEKQLRALQTKVYAGGS